MAEAERDESLRLSGHRPAGQGEATRWLQPWRDTNRKLPDIEELPVYEEVLQQLIEAMPVEKRPAGLASAQALGACTHELRLAELAPAPWILALPLEVLHVLPEEYLRTFPAEVQRQVRKRLQGAAHGGPRHLAPPT